MEADSAGLLSGSGTMDEVALGAVAYGDCVVTMSVNVEMMPTSASTAEGQAYVTISDPRGDDDRCPVYEADPCNITLTLMASID